MGEISDRDARSLRLLRTLVTVLTSVMIIGFLVLIAFLVTRFPDVSRLALPDQINLPANMRAIAFTQADDWYAVVTDASQILIFDRVDGKLRQTVDVVPLSQ